MTVQELHLQVNQRLQEIASYKRDKMFPEEIDMALNKAMFRLLEEGIEKNFSEDQDRLAHVSALIKKNRVAEAIIPSPGSDQAEENLDVVYAVLAPDLYWAINARVETVVDPTNCSTAPDLGTTSYSEYVAKIKLPAANPTAPYFASLKINSSTIGDIYVAPAGLAGGFNSKNSSYILISNIREQFYQDPAIKVYWERYRDVYTQGTLIFVSTVSLGTITITGTNLTPVSVTETRNDYTIFNRGLIPSLPNKKVDVRPVKINEPHLLYSSLKENQFYRSTVIEVAADQTYDFITFYRDKSFIVTRVYYDYVRKPRTISLSLGQSCELSEATHPKVVDLAVEILRLDTKDPAYQQTVQDIQLRTN